MIHLFKDYKFRIINILILFCIALYSFEHYHTSSIIFAFTNAFLIQSLLLLTARYKIIFIVLALFVSLIIGLEVSQIAAYSSPFNYGIIASIFETNRTEAISMFSVLSKYIFLYLFILLILFSSFIMVLKEQMKKELKKQWIFLMFFFSLSIVTIKSYRYITKDKSSYSSLKNDFNRYPLLTANEFFFQWSPSLFRSLALVTAYFQEQYNLKKIISMKQNFPHSILELDSTIIKKPNSIFIVIGESSNRNNYSLYGYNTQTTPVLDSLDIRHKLLHFSFLSPAAITRDAVPFLMTFGTPQNPDLQYTEESIITLAKNIGYETYWISNQDKAGMYDSPVGYIAARSEYSFYQSEEIFYQYRDDLHLIDQVKKIYSSNKKQLIVIHLRGSHQAYGLGCDSVDRRNLSPNIKFPDNLDYDRTIYHTNRVLSSLYNNFFDENENSCDSVNKILFYTSDHGEIVNVGHGVVHTNMEQFKIPFIVFGSSYFNKIDSLVNKYSNNGISNSTNFPYIFSEIIGYKIKDDAVKKAKNDALYYKQTDKMILKFPINTK